MWRDIFLSNRAAMQAELTEVRAVLDEAERALNAGDGAALQSLLEQAALFRRDWKAGR
jgi:prephenate dehydrogenase